MKLIIAGSRNVPETDEMIDRLENFLFTFAMNSGNISEVVSGCASGGDTLGELWAERNNIPIKKFPANWKKYGRAAGPIRNKEMGNYADMAAVVWDGESNGSRHMINYMKKLNKPCHVFLYKENDLTSFIRN